MINISEYHSPIGKILLAAKNNALAGLWIEHQKYYFASFREQPEADDRNPVLVQAKAWLDRYFAGEQPDICELSLAPEGSIFRKTVLEVLCEIPYGKTVTYGEVAQTVAKRLKREHMSAQAVGGAIGHNPISIIIPCHRVVGADGSLTGYAGGIARKIHLLQHEGVDMTNLYVPEHSTSP